MVIDYSQTINKFCLPDAYPIPNIVELVNDISLSKFFSRLDLKSAYRQIPLHPDDRCYTAFQAGNSLYQFKGLPFGITNAVSSFQRVMDSIISDNNLHGVKTYLDDVIITGKTREEHDSNLNEFMRVCTELNLTLNKDKCIVSQTQIQYLG